jgi:alpha-glucosidase
MHSTYLNRPSNQSHVEHDLITVGETPFTHSIDQLTAYVLPVSEELNMVFQFELMDIDSPQNGDSGAEVSQHDPLNWKEWKLSDMKDVVGRWQTCKRDEGFWNACVCLNLVLWC